MNTKEFGQIIERKFCFECAKNNILICQPLGDTAPFDFIIELEGRLLKVQCKSLRKYKGRYVAETHRKTGNKRKIKVSYIGLADYFFLYNLEDDISLFIPVEYCRNSSTTFNPKGQFGDFSTIRLTSAGEIGSLNSPGGYTLD